MSDRAPSSSHEWPRELRRYLTQRLLDKALEQHGGWQGVAVWLYAGQKHPSTPDRLPFSPSVDFLYPIMLADARAWAGGSPSSPSAEGTTHG